MTVAALSGTQQVTKWVLIAAGIVIVLAFIAVAGRRIVSGLRSAHRGRRLASRIRTNTAYDLRADAASQVLALGERIDTAQLAEGADEHFDGALECYTLARRVQRNARGSADHLGAVVLAAEGRRHLDAALGDASYDDRPRCFFDPRHGAAVGAVDGPTGTRTPACGECESADARSRAVFTVDGLPYYDADVEPWASSGYGALHDVVPAVRDYNW